ncbi:uncharacterized protein LOC110450473 isoform X2 [Mizuhopecten yessoensis]|uniref:uncharacterized protein LOC110450473 isoform X2 n=1 Tax=Mizuhopecten yessoensis TaxID=6573 RepID=UPI000B45DC5C|nr:uncharacterized protein LOC110450473 isoform X2 [Mizuhopecten yessoensis]
MAERPPLHKHSGAWDCGLDMSTICFIILSCIFVLSVLCVIAYSWYSPTEQPITVQSNVNVLNSNGKKRKKKKMVIVNCEHAMIGDTNILQQGCISPILDDSRNREPTGFMKKTVSVWKKRADDLFVTKGMRNAMEFSKHNNLLIITGPQGSGKSSALRYVSVALKHDGFIVYPCMKPSDIEYYWDETKKQVFVIDDPIGSECVSLVGVQMMERYSDRIKTCIAGHTTKVILAIRSEILNDKYVSSSETLVTSRQNEIDLTEEENALSEQERKDMFSHYVSRTGVRNISLQMPQLHCFPLLCHAFFKVGTIRKNPTEFFSSPFSVIKDAFIRMRQRNPAHFCLLVFCIVFENKLSRRNLALESPEREKVDRVLEILGLNREKVQSNVINAIDALNGVYLTKNGTSYAFLHSLFQDIVTFILGEESTMFLFKYCSSTFLRSHVKIADTPAKIDEHAIVLEPSDYKSLAERMCEELQKRNVEDVFYHSSLGNRQFLKVFMRECSKNKTIEYSNENKIPLLAWSCRVEMFRLAKALLDKGADLNICDEFKRSALIWVCRNSCRSIEQSRAMVTILLKEGVDVKLADKRNQTAIIYAVRKGDIQIVHNLLDHGACVKELSADISPLNLAVKCAQKHTRTHVEPDTDQKEHSSTAIVRLLLEKGADPNFKVANDKTMLYQSVLGSNTAVSKCLLEHGADVGKSNTLNEDLLCSAISNRLSDLVDPLLERGVDVNIPNHFSRTSLHLAVIENNSDLVTQLIKAGACVDSKDSEGETPLHLSVKDDKKYIVRNILLRKGADVNSEDKRGRTPRMWYLRTLARVSSQNFRITEPLHNETN